MTSRASDYVATPLALMHAGGIPDQAAAWACDALLLYTVATAVGHAIEGRPTLPGHKSPDRDYAGAARELFGSLPADRPRDPTDRPRDPTEPPARPDRPTKPPG
jgi:hypothetical protein